MKPRTVLITNAKLQVVLQAASVSNISVAKPKFNMNTTA